MQAYVYLKRFYGFGLVCPILFKKAYIFIRETCIGLTMVILFCTLCSKVFLSSDKLYLVGCLFEALSYISKYVSSYGVYLLAHLPTRSYSTTPCWLFVTAHRSYLPLHTFWACVMPWRLGQTYRPTLFLNIFYCGLRQDWAVSEQRKEGNKMV